MEEQIEFSEEEIYDLLDKAYDKTGNTCALIFRYRFQSLFEPGAPCACGSDLTFKDAYIKLRQHERFYCSALSLVIYMIQGHDYNEGMDVLKPLTELVKSTRSYDTDIILQRLNLWMMLTNIAAELHEEDSSIQNLVSMVGCEINMNTDKIVVGEDQYSLASVLRAFSLLEDKKKLTSLLERHPKELAHPGKQLLESLIKKKFYVKYVEEFNPDQPLTLAVLKVERMRIIGSQDDQAFTEYKSGLCDAYKTMSIIEPTQWPPVNKHFYINLAIITSDYMPRDDTYSRATIRGSVDDVYKKKESVEFNQVFHENLSSNNRYVSLIQGRPGSGKSTLITKVSKDWADGRILKNIEFFLLIRLRRFVDKKDLTLKDLLGIHCPNRSVLDVIHDRVTNNGGRGVCFAFDGLDEYSSKLTDKNNLIMKIILSDFLPHAAIFLTSRPATAQRFKTILTKNVEIIGFLEKEIQEYIDSYYENDEAKACRLKKYIKDHPNIERMCYIPLHIAMVVFLYDLDPNNSILPTTETDLYYKFTLHTLHRSLVKDLTEGQDRDDINFSKFFELPKVKFGIFKEVCKLAFIATVEQIQMFTGEKIKKLACLPEIPKKSDFNSLGLLTVDRMIARSSLLTTTFSFLHLTFQEFLAAVHIVNHLSDSEQLATVKQHAGKVHMWVVWKFLCGIHAKNSEDFTNRSDIFARVYQCIIADNVSTRLSCLNMAHCAFESQYQESCVDLLVLLEGTIDVTEIALNPSDCSALGYVLAKACTVIKEIDFSYCHLGPSGIAAFVQQLQAFEGKLTEAHTLRLRARIDHKPVGSEGALTLQKLLKKLPNLGELRLYGNKLSTYKFRYLSPTIAELRQIHTLILSRNDLEVDTGPLVSDVLGNLPLLHTFYISYNPLTEIGLGSMKPGLLKCKKLKILGLRGTSLKEGAGIHLSEILSTLTKLEWIELYQNQLGNEGVCDMMPGLLKSKSLHTLGLVENNISDSGAFSLVKYISVTNTLRIMRIYYNNGMTQDGKIALRKAVVERPKHLCDLGLAV